VTTLYTKRRRTTSHNPEGGRSTAHNTQRHVHADWNICN